MYKFYIKIIDDTEKKIILTIDDISNASIFLKELCNKLSITKENSYYTVVNIKNEKTIKYKSDNKKNIIGYITTKDIAQEILKVEENYFKYYADKYNLLEFEIECKKYSGNAVNTKVHVHREDLSMGDTVGLEKDFIIKPFEYLSSIVNRGMYSEYYKNTVINYTDLDENKISKKIRIDGNLTIADMAFSNFVELYKINTDKPIILQLFK